MTALAVSLVVAFGLVIGLVAWSISASVQDNQATNVASPPFVPPTGMNQDGGIDFPVAVHSVASVQKMINRTLILPTAASVSAVGPSLRLIGVSIDGNSASPQKWEVSIFYSASGSFINGTTTVSELVGKSGISITEVPVPLGVNSSQVAHEQLAPRLVTSCRTITASSPYSSSSATCQTSTAVGGPVGDSVVIQNGLSILVNPFGTLSWADGRQGVGVGISSNNLSTGQLLSLASTMTATSSSSK